LNIEDFRTIFPEFSSELIYSDARITYWSNLAEDRLNKTRLEKLYWNAVYLYTAHYLVLQQRDIKAAENGEIPGFVMGIASSKSVGSVSVSYSNIAGWADLGFWSLTTYGLQLYELMQMYGMGAIQL
jgi:hypothetical protein